MYSYHLYSNVIINFYPTHARHIIVNKMTVCGNWKKKKKSIKSLTLDSLIVMWYHADKRFSCFINLHQWFIIVVPCKRKFVHKSKRQCTKIHPFKNFTKPKCTPHMDKTNYLRDCNTGFYFLFDMWSSWHKRHFLPVGSRLSSLFYRAV